MQDEERAAEILRDLLKDKLAVTKWKELLELAGRCYRYSCLLYTSDAADD